MNLDFIRFPLMKCIKIDKDEQAWHRLKIEAELKESKIQQLYARRKKRVQP